MGRNDRRVAAIRVAVFGKEVREPIVKSLVKTLDISNGKLDDMVVKHNNRIKEATIEAIPEQENYYTLVLTRANGT